MPTPFVAPIIALLSLSADPPRMYLPAQEAGGTEYQFDPASPALRRAVKKRQERPDDLLNARALAEDLVFLRQALRKIYSGYPELLQAPGFDVEARFDREIARLRGGPDKVKFGDSVLPLFRDLKRHINDGHLAMSGWDPEPQDRFLEYQTALTDPPPALDTCTVPQASTSTLRLAPALTANGKRGQLVTVSARSQGDTVALDCANRRLALSPRPLASDEEGEAEKPSYEWRRAGNAGIIRIRRFMGTPVDVANLEQFVKDYPKHRRAPIIVFDLRGNDGGNDAYTYDWISQAKRGTWATEMWALHPVWSNASWFLWNFEVWMSIDQDRVDDPASLAERTQHRAKWPRSPAELSLSIRTDANHDNARLPYRGRVFVLIDRRCGSSGESSALALRAALGATLVGERSGGHLEFGNVRPFVLPRTGLRFFFATKRNYFRTPIESVGIPADVYLAPELMGKPVEELLPMLKRLPR